MPFMSFWRSALAHAFFEYCSISPLWQILSKNLTVSGVPGWISCSFSEFEFFNWPSTFN